jgi:hypothetical protein
MAPATDHPFTYKVEPHTRRHKGQFSWIVFEHGRVRRTSFFKRPYGTRHLAAAAGYEEMLKLAAKWRIRGQGQ